MAATKKGIVVTTIILAAIASASFFVWLIPQNTQTTVTVVTDFESHIQGVANIHKVLKEELDDAFEKLQNKEITPQEYEQIAQTTSTQINSQIIQLVESKAPEIWHQSYIDYIEALRAQNSIIRETMVVSNLIEKQAEQENIQESIDKINELKSGMESLIESSSQNIP